MWSFMLSALKEFIASSLLLYSLLIFFLKVLNEFNEAAFLL